MLKDHIAFRLNQEAIIKTSGKLTLAQLLDESNLSEREASVLELLVNGEGATTISRKLSIAETTVKKHITNIYRKLNVNNKIQIINKIK